ncbi:MAG: M1 family metallopeptidase [Thermoanaerobaculia bacterium]
MSRIRWTPLAAGALLVVASCAPPGGEIEPEIPERAEPAVSDTHSFSRPHEIAVSHLELDLTVDFDRQQLSGTAVLEWVNKSGAERLYLDARGLDITHVRRLDDGSELNFQLGEEVPFLGQELSVALPEGTRAIEIAYSTRPDAEALQWLEPVQTAGGRHPFLFTQSQAILARTWVPCQDTPGVRFTYGATVRVPAELMALMSAENPTGRSADGVYRFEMRQRIPSYLLALAVGDLEFRSLGPRSGVYAEPSLVERAAWEFAEVEQMMAATEKLYGPYRWERYDLLVLPPSFPFGGMENPRLTFATPTILAGDRSLVALVAHELAHSWSGNLVTNATWNDFWLNEGFTSYIENRIMEEIKGPEYAAMLRVLSLQELRREIEDLGPDSTDTHLFLDLAGRNPDDGMTAVPYDKGAALLRLLEETLGRERWDAFLLDYFDTHAFQSMDTAGFVAFLEESFGDAPQPVGVNVWVYGPGIPENLLIPESETLAAVERQIASWRRGAPARDLATGAWTTHEWLHFLRSLPKEVDAAGMSELDHAFRLSESGNAEILCAWLTEAVRKGYRPAYPALERFLTSVGRRKFLKPLYTELAKTAEGLAWARKVYAEARPGYHAISTGTIDEILGWREPAEGS